MLNNVKAMEMNENELVNVNGGAWYNDVIDWCGDRVNDVSEWFDDTCNEGLAGKIIAGAGMVAITAGGIAMVAIGAATAGPVILAGAGIAAMLGGAALMEDAEKKEKAK